MPYNAKLDNMVILGGYNKTMEHIMAGLSSPPADVWFLAASTKKPAAKNHKKTFFYM
jgi:hypothetical protein